MTSKVLLSENKKLTDIAKVIFGDIVECGYLVGRSYGSEYSITRSVASDFVNQHTDLRLDGDKLEFSSDIAIKFISGNTVMFNFSEWAWITRVRDISIVGETTELTYESIEEALNEIQ